MSKKYDLANKSDMRRFNRDLEKTIKSKAIHAINKEKYEVECPHCKNSVKIPVGLSHCPKCNKTIDFKLDIKFD